MERKSSSLLMLAAAMCGIPGTENAFEVLPSKPAPRLARGLVFAGGSQTTMRGHGRRNWPGRKPPGTYWRGDGVVPAETRQMRRSAARMER